MRRPWSCGPIVVAALALAGAIALARTAPGAEKADKPDATIELEEGSVALGIGYSWGKGVLTYKGKRYPFKITGFSAGELGGTKIQARGDVYYLKRLEDFDGTYTAVGAGATAGGGYDAETMRNPSGVHIRMVSSTEGADLRAAVSGVQFTLER